MAQLRGDELILYSYKDLDPIGCEDSFILNITSNEIITTTKGSGRSTNREYGSYDWNIQCTGVITINESNKVSSLNFNDDIMTGKKVAIKATVGSEFYFGLGIITSIANTATSGEFAKFDLTIAGDGILYSTNNLKNTEKEPTILYITDIFNTTVTSPALLNATILIVFFNDIYIPQPNNYIFTPNNGYGSGVFDWMQGASQGDVIKVYYVPA